MFINTGGLPEHHRQGRGKFHLQCHHHAHRPLQRFDQLHLHLHLPHRSGRLSARGRLLCPGARHHGSFSPAARLLNGPTLLCLNAPPLASPHPTQSSLLSLSETTRLKRMDTTASFVLSK